MKHKRVFYALTVVMYVVVVLLSFAFLFSIKEVKCNYYAVSYSTKYEQVEKQLNKYNGKNLLFVNTDKIVSELEKDTYIVVKSIKKDFPNKILVEIEEREETFYIESSTHRYYLDKNYFVLKKVDKQSNDLNNNLIKLDLSLYNDFSVEDLIVGETFTMLNGWIQNCVGEMITIFSDWKNILDSIIVEGTNKIVGYTIYFQTKQGLKIEVLDPNIKIDLENNSYIYEESTSEFVGIEEVQEAYKVYSTISDYEKTKGKLLVYRLPDNKITVVYTLQV